MIVSAAATFRHKAESAVRNGSPRFVASQLQEAKKDGAGSRDLSILASP